MNPALRTQLLNQFYALVKAAGASQPKAVARQLVKMVEYGWEPPDMTKFQPVEGGYEVWVRSSSDASKWHRVTLLGRDNDSCTCEAFTYQQAVCKHIFAARRILEWLRRCRHNTEQVQGAVAQRAQAVGED